MRLVSSNEPSQTLMGRVARIAAIAAIGGGLCAALAAVTLAEIKVERAEDRRLTEEAREIVDECAALPTDEIAAHLDIEATELQRAGLRFAVFHEGKGVGGELSLSAPNLGCETRGVRACVVHHGAWSCVVASDDAPTLGGVFTVGIVCSAVFVAALLGVFASRRLARWAVGPLVRLRQRLGDAPMDKATDLGADEGILEIDALRKNLRTLLDRRAEALRSARLFAAGAAHELRTPLTTLSGELELLSEESLAPVLCDRIHRLHAITTRIVELVERLLILARVGAAEAMRHDAVELSELLDEVCRRCVSHAPDRLTYEARATPLVRGDEALLSVMCENVINNALAHAAPAEVHVVLDEIDGEAILDVLDKGPGIDPNEEVRLFEPFQRGTTSSAGAGLGLALVRQVARAHGGDATFMECGVGTHLRVRVPRWTPQPGESNGRKELKIP